MIRTPLLGVLVLLSSAGISAGQGKQPVPRDELRYDGKTFAYWETFPRTELKAEKRIDALRAMAAFGARGYAKEAAAAIVELLKDYDNDEAAFVIAANEKPSPDQQLIQEALWALRKIGPDADPIVLAQLERPAARRVALLLYGPGSGLPTIDGSFAILIGWLESRDDDVRTAAIEILGHAIYWQPDAKAKAVQALFIDRVAKHKNPAAIVNALERALEPLHDAAKPAFLLGVLGARAKSAVPALVRADLHASAHAGGEIRAALAAIQPTPAERLPGLLMELKETKGWPMRGAAANQLAELGAPARVALPDLLAELKKPMPNNPAFQHSEYQERVAILSAYVKLADATDALIAIRDLLDKQQLPELERELVQAYVKLEPDPKQNAAMLTKALERYLAWKKKPVHEGAVHARYIVVQGGLADLAHALAAQGEHAGSAVPLMLKAYEQADIYAGLAIVQAFGKIGPPARDALPVLSKLLQSDNAEWRQAAAKAIEAITKK